MLCYVEINPAPHPPSALLDQPPLPLRREEGVHEVVVGLVGYPEGLLPDVPVDELEDVPGEVAAAVDPPVLPDELLGGDLGPADVGVVQGRVQHDDGEADDVAGVRLVEQVRVLLAVAAGEGLHHPVDLHGLSGEPVGEVRGCYCLCPTNKGGEEERRGGEGGRGRCYCLCPTNKGGEKEWRGGEGGGRCYCLCPTNKGGEEEWRGGGRYYLCCSVIAQPVRVERMKGEVGEVTVSAVVAQKTRVERSGEVGDVTASAVVLLLLPNQPRLDRRKGEVGHCCWLGASVIVLIGIIVTAFVVIVLIAVAAIAVAAIAVAVIAVVIVAPVAAIAHLPEAPQELPEGLHQDEVGELVAADELPEDVPVELPVSADEAADLLLGEPALAEEELRSRPRVARTQETGLRQHPGGSRGVGTDGIVKGCQESVPS